MLIEVPKEIKTPEYRIGLTPASVRELIEKSHKVIVQTNGALEIGITDDDYRTGGAAIADTPEEICATADMIVKAREPQPNGCKMLRDGQLLAPDPEQTKGLVESGCVTLADEAVAWGLGYDYVPAEKALGI